MRRTIVTFFMIIGCFLLQTTVLQILPISIATPNLLLVLTVSMGLMHGRRSGMLTGFVSGLLIDLFFSNLFGFYALCFMYIGYLNGFLYQVFFDEDIRVPMVMVAISDFAYNIVFYFIQFAFRLRFGFVLYLKRTILPELIYTVILTLIFYRLFYAINKKLVKSEMEEQQSPWLRR